MRIATFILLLCAFSAHAATLANGDSCDISVLPAATLLLPYFEVDLGAVNGSGETTLFTITNVTNLDQIAHVTLWTDYGFPVLDFNIYLTGYDVQAINLFDILVRGVIGQDVGTGTLIQKRGKWSDPNTALNLTACDRLPGPFDVAYVQRLQHAFTRGSVPPLGIFPGCASVGGKHEHAIGYATIDVTRICSTSLPTDPGYFTNEIKHDNVLIGDYQQVNGAENYAQGGSMVHIRAVPEGGPSSSALPRTFYSRYQSGKPPVDGRQPLPSTFAARWISGGGSEFTTSLKVWREGRTNERTACAGFAGETRRRVTEIVVFDENENAVTMEQSVLPSTSRTNVTDTDVYPRAANGASAGWMYLNLDSSAEDAHASQNWVVTSMRAHGRFSTDIESIALGNGCTPPQFGVRRPEPPLSYRGTSGAPPPYQSGGSGRRTPNTAGPPLHISTNNDDSCDIALLPAATLLLPYFEVDLENTGGETTLFTVTNVSPVDQIARVTLWTDGAYPVLTFNVFLTGYDVQSINLYDVLVRGLIAPDGGTGSRVRPRGDRSHRNTALDLTDCRQLPGALPAEAVVNMRRAFTLGVIPGCNTGGLVHDNAVGYATIDVVRACTDNIPTDAAYWTHDIRHDNVLTGDYQQVNGDGNFAQGAPMVHVRAVTAPFQHTFYGHYQAAATPHLDGRQPLPSTFAARWISGGTAGFKTGMKIWREAKSGLATCAAARENTAMVHVETVRFDEAENAIANGPFPCRLCAPCLSFPDTFAATGLHEVTDQDKFPQLTNGAQAGWMYMNLDNCDRDAHGSSNWIVTSLRAQGRFSVDVDAAALGNGCSPPAPQSEVRYGDAVIGPARKTP